MRTEWNKVKCIDCGKEFFNVSRELESKNETEKEIAHRCSPCNRAEYNRKVKERADLAREVKEQMMQDSMMMNMYGELSAEELKNPNYSEEV